MVALNVIGLNCGTSVDGVDVALVRIETVGSADIKIELQSYREHPVPPATQKRILALCRPGATTTLEEVCDLNFELGELFADAVLSSGIDLSSVDLIASHGQTLWHTPTASNTGRGYARGERRMATLQMAESAVISRKTGITVANDFRVAELAAGRQGAPLSGFFEAALLRDPAKVRVSQNIGGMGNATVIPTSGYMAFDTGPGNVLIDSAVRMVSNGAEEYDKDGARAAAGASDIDTAFIDEWIGACDYLALPPPKTTGRELFSEAMGRDIVQRLRDRGVSDNGIVATVTKLSAETIISALKTFVEPQYGQIDELFVCGGGAANPVTMEYLRAAFPAVEPLDNAAKLPAAAKEAVLFATLGFLCVSGRSVPVSSVEKSKEQTVMGKITPGKNFVHVMKEALSSDGVLGRILVQ